MELPSTLEQLTLGLETYSLQKPFNQRQSYSCKEAAASNDDVLSQDIEEAVVIKEAKKIQPTKQTAKKKLNQSQRNPKTFKKHLWRFIKSNKRP